MISPLRSQMECLRGEKEKMHFDASKIFLKKSNISQASGLCKTSRSLTALNNWTRILSSVNLREERGTDHDVSLTEEGGNLFGHQVHSSHVTSAQREF